MLLNEFESHLDARLSRYKLDFPHVSRELRDGNEPISRLSRRNFTLLLYAYWESIIKQTIKDYIEHVEHTAQHYDELIRPLRLAHLPNHLTASHSHLSGRKSTSLSVDLSKFQDYEDELFAPTSPKVYSDTLFGSQSNLNWERFERILAWAGLPLPELRLDIQDPFTIGKAVHSNISKKITYHYSNLEIKVWLGHFLHARNNLAHSALLDPPSYDHCVFFGLFISELLAWFSNIIRDAAENEHWRVKIQN